MEVWYCRIKVPLWQCPPKSLLCSALCLCWPLQCQKLLLQDVWQVCPDGCEWGHHPYPRTPWPWLWWDTRARGLGATRTRPVSTAGEENALCLTHDSYYVEDILLHEFSHGLHLLGLRYSIPNFDSRLKALYNSAKAKGLWQNTYALSTGHEYFVSIHVLYEAINDEKILL